MATLVDTNILVYAFDPGHPERQNKALRLFENPPDELVVSAQVLQEFYALTTRKRLLTPEQARLAVHQVMDRQVIPTTASMVADAIELSISTQTSIWDALIVEAARSYGCRTLWSEDLQHGQTIRGVRVLNPFN